MKQPLKRSKLGIEIELMTLDKKGRVINKADEVIKETRKLNIPVLVTKECAKNMVEISSYPRHGASNSMADALTHLETVLLRCEKLGITMLPLGTYPGKFTPSMRTDPSYKATQKLFGRETFKIAGRCVGFHCHYSLPKGVFDTKKRTIRHLVRSKQKQSMVDCYNLLIAMDPALMTFTQSSPYYQGKHIGKDSRAIMYRGGHWLRNKEALYHDYVDWGELPPYKATGTDLIYSIKQRHKRWIRAIKTAAPTYKPSYPSELSTTWGPVKINPHGTLEQRGMDMNHISTLIAASVVIKYALKQIQQTYLRVLPSDAGEEHPFKTEDDKLLIPPHSHVRSNLQYEAAYNGMASKSIQDYCKRFMRFAEQIVPKNRQHLLAPFNKMMYDKKTESDHLMAYARKHGDAAKEGISQETAQDLALDHARRLYKEIVLAKQTIEELE